MTLSRRKFVKAGIIAAACAPLLPLKSILAKAWTNQPSSASLNQLTYYNESAFKPYVNTDFRVYLSPSEVRALQLTEVVNHDTPSQQPSLVISAECFSLLFALAPGEHFAQDTYLIDHDALGSFYLFVVPVSPESQQSQDFYEAVIYRREQYGIEILTKKNKKPLSLTTSQSATTAASITTSSSANKSTTQPTQSVIEGAPLIDLPGNQAVSNQEAQPNAKEESDVYRFRPAELAPPVAAEQANVPPKKIVYPLSLSQSPVINGLKLGMTPDEVLALFPGSERDEEVRRDLSRPPSRFGVSHFRIIPQKYSSKSKLDHVTQILFTLFDGRVSTLYLGSDGPVWEHVDEFVTEFSQGRNLPAADQWEAYIGMDTQLKTLNCKEFEISLFAGGQNVQINYAQVRDLIALQKYKEREAKAEAEEMKKNAER